MSSFIFRSCCVDDGSDRTYSHVLSCVAAAAAVDVITGERAETVSRKPPHRDEETERWDGVRAKGAEERHASAAERGERHPAS